MRELEGKNAVVTGSNRGIGYAIVKKLAENGCNLWACARKFNQDFEDNMKSLSEKYDVNIKPVYFDLINEEEIKEGFKSIYKERKDIDILVNNAGILHSNIFQMTTMEQMKEVYQVNLFSMMQLTQLVLKVMVRKKKGSIINISSISGIDANPKNCIYGSSKAAVIAFTHTLASEVGRMNIRVNSIAPGPTDTDIIAPDKDYFENEYIKRIALNRLGKPDDIANIAVFLASDKSNYINGQTIRADGG